MRCIGSNTSVYVVKSSNNYFLGSGDRPAPVALLVASQYALPGDGDRRVCVQGPGWPDHLCQVIAAYALRLNFRAGTEGSTVSSLILTIPTLVIDHSFSLSLQAQNLPFQQILPTVDFFYLLDDNGTGPDLLRSSFYF